MNEPLAAGIGHFHEVHSGAMPGSAFPDDLRPAFDAAALGQFELEGKHLAGRSRPEFADGNPVFAEIEHETVLGFVQQNVHRCIESHTLKAPSLLSHISSLRELEIETDVRSIDMAMEAGKWNQFPNRAIRARTRPSRRVDILEAMR